MVRRLGLGKNNRLTYTSFALNPRAVRGMLNQFAVAIFPKYCMGKMGKRNKSQHLGFLLHNILHNCHGVYRILKTLALKADEKFVTYFYEKERKLDK